LFRIYGIHISCTLSYLDTFDITRDTLIDAYAFFFSVWACVLAPVPTNLFFWQRNHFTCSCTLKVYLAKRKRKNHIKYLKINLHFTRVVLAQRATPQHASFKQMRMKLTF